MNCKTIKNTAVFIFFVLFYGAAFAQSVFSDKLTGEEQQKLANGEILIRNIAKAKNMCLNPVSPQAEQVLEMVKTLKPAYLAEVIQIRPYAGNEDILKHLRPLLLDVKGYTGIPYWSERQQTYYDLYTSAKILKSDITEIGGHMSVDFEMEPFGEPNMDIRLDNSRDWLIYAMTNTGNLRYYDQFTAVAAKKMKSIVYVFKHNDSIVLYGLGGVNAPSVFFLRDRIETSFINRIKTFCQFIFEKI